MADENAVADDTAIDAEDDALVEVADKPREATPYERKLRLEKRKLAGRVRELEAQVSQIGATERARADGEIAAARSDADRRVVSAKIEAVALKAGLVDVDALALADLSAVTLGADGRLTGAEAAIAALKEAKPYLFGATGTTSSAAATPKTAETKPKHASQMTREEWNAEKRRLGFN